MANRKQWQTKTWFLFFLNIDSKIRCFSVISLKTIKAKYIIRSHLNSKNIGELYHFGGNSRNWNNLPQATHLLRQKKSMYKLLVLKQLQCIFPAKIQTMFLITEFLVYFKQQFCDVPYLQRIIRKYDYDLRLKKHFNKHKKVRIHYKHALPSFRRYFKLHLWIAKRSNFI